MTIEREVRAKLAEILNGSKPPAEIAACTSVRAAVGLVIGELADLTQLNESQAWEYLNPENVAMVRQLQREYCDRVRQAGFPGP